MYVLHGRLRKVDMATRAVTTITRGLPGSQNGCSVLHDGSQVLVTADGGNVPAVSLPDGGISDFVTEISRPNGVTLSTDGTKAYVVDYNNNALVQIDVASRTVTTIWWRWWVGFGGGGVVTPSRPPFSMLLESYCSLENPLKKGSPALALAHYRFIREDYSPWTALDVVRV